MRTYEHDDPTGDENFMTKDYANRRRFDLKASRMPNGMKLMPWIGGGAAIVLIAGMLLAYQQFFKSSTPAHSVDLRSSAAPVHEKAPSETHTSIAKQEAPRFDFYTLLPNMTVEVPELEPEPEVKRKTALAAAPKVAQAPAPAPASTAQNNKSSNFIIQAGSFREPAQAEELKARLTLNGFEASIQTVKIEQQDLWYRVFLGPYEDKNQAILAQQKLESAQSINSLILKIQV